MLGISSDSVDRHERFVAEERLPYALLSDPDGATRERYAVKRSMLGLLPGRVTITISRDGRVLGTFASQLNIREHVEFALRSLAETPEEGGARS